MKNEFTYDPEDLESLMMHKSFIELYPEERTFVLKHLSSPDEYESMRSTLFAILETKGDDEVLSSTEGTKANVMDAFRAENKKEKWFSLNGLFILLFPPNRSWIQKPAFQMAIFAAVIFGGFLIFNGSNSEPDNQLAELKPKTTTETKAPKADSAVIDNIEVEAEEITVEANETPAETIDKPAQTIETTPETIEISNLDANFDLRDETNEKTVKALKKESNRLADLQENREAAEEDTSLAMDAQDKDESKTTLTTGDLASPVLEQDTQTTLFFTEPNYNLTTPDIAINEISSSKTFKFTETDVAQTISTETISAEKRAVTEVSNADDLAKVFTLLEAAY
ncbi:MAG: hypothetical protein ACJAU0_001164 [Flavobacteriales bacterium]|jgi:hypothetical protein